MCYRLNNESNELVLLIPMHTSAYQCVHQFSKQLKPYLLSEQHNETQTKQILFLSYYIVHLKLLLCENSSYLNYFQL